MLFSELDGEKAGFKFGFESVLGRLIIRAGGGGGGGAVLGKQSQRTPWPLRQWFTRDRDKTDISKRCGKSCPGYVESELSSHTPSQRCSTSSVVSLTAGPKRFSNSNGGISSAVVC